MLGPAVAQVDREEAAPHPEGASRVRGRCGEGGTAERAGQGGRGEGLAGSGGERESGREERREREVSASSSLSSFSFAPSSKGHEGDDREQIHAAPGSGEDPGDERDARGSCEGAGRDGGCLFEGERVRVFGGLLRKRKEGG